MESCYGIDITEIDGFDQLHCPQGILWKTMQRAGRLFGAETYLLVNGSTGGILSAVSAAVRRGDRILMARNCHKAAFHAVYLNGCRTEYIHPYYLERYGLCGAVSPVEVERGLDAHADIRAVLVTSPTYDGVVSDVAAIAKLSHRRGIPLIVDAAHGAHFILDKRFPENAAVLGADLVIHSIHKTLPALTQTALLHVQGDLIDRDRLRRFLSVYQTSSPSYILLAGIEQCISILEQKREQLCGRFFALNEEFEKKAADLRCLRLLSSDLQRYKGKEIFDYDTGKKVISTAGTTLTGRNLYRMLLEEYDLQMEMAGQSYVTAIMTVMDKEEGFLRLADALQRIDRCLEDARKRGGEEEPGEYGPAACGGGTGGARENSFQDERAEWPKEAYDIYTALEQESETLLAEDCVGEVAAEFIHIYPPGIPLIVPGEYFTESVVRRLLSCRAQGFTIEGMKENNQKVCVIRNRPARPGRYASFGKEKYAQN